MFKKLFNNTEVLGLTTNLQLQDFQQIKLVLWREKPTELKWKFKHGLEPGY